MNVFQPLTKHSKSHRCHALKMTPQTPSQAWWGGSSPPPDLVTNLLGGGDGEMEQRLSSRQKNNMNTRAKRERETGAYKEHRRNEWETHCPSTPVETGLSRCHSLRSRAFNRSDQCVHTGQQPTNTHTHTHTHTHWPGNRQSGMESCFDQTLRYMFGSVPCFSCLSL